MISPEPGYYKSFKIHLFPIQDEKSELTYMVLNFHMEEQYPEQVFLFQIIIFLILFAVYFHVAIVHKFLF